MAISLHKIREPAIVKSAFPATPGSNKAFDQSIEWQKAEESIVTIWLGPVNEAALKKTRSVILGRPPSGDCQ